MSAAPHGSPDAPALSGRAAEPYINYAAPQVEAAFGDDVQVSKSGTAVDKRGDAIARAMAFDAKHAEGNPVAARELAKLEAKSLRTGKSPKAIKSQYKGATATQEAKLLTILVEFNDKAADDFTGVQVPTAFGATDCKLGSVQSGPLNNTIPNPAVGTHPDNNSMWVQDFSSEHYNKMLYTKEGITDRVRTDLTGPDGQPGFDISGYTMKNMYEEMSHGAYTVTGEATPWVTVDHSEALVRRLDLPRRTTRASGRPARSRTCRAIPTTRSARASSRSTRSPRSPRRSPTSRGRTTTSRTRATSTVTTTTTSPTA